MIPPDHAPEIETLYAYLRGRAPAGHPDLPQGEAALADRMRRAAEGAGPEPGFRAALERQLAGQLPGGSPGRSPTTRRSPAWRRQLRDQILGYGRAAAWIGLALALTLGIGWGFRNLIARPVAPAALPGQETVFTPPPPTPTTSSPEAAAGISSSSMFPGVELVLAAALPSQPEAATLYSQKPHVALTLESALARARQLDLSGQIYQLEAGQSGQTNYLVTDGRARLQFFDSPDHFIYYPDITRPPADAGPELPFETRAAIAEEFLTARGLLDFPYRIEPSTAGKNTVRLVPLLEDHPVAFGSFIESSILVAVRPDGEIESLQYRRNPAVPAGQYRIRSAQAAWEQALSPETRRGVMVSTFSVRPGDLQSWVRPVTPGGRRDLYGTIEILPPVEREQAPYLAIDNLPLTGDLEALAQRAHTGDFLHVWGQLEENGDERRSFRLEGWEPSPLADQVLSGAIQRRGGAVYLQVEGRNLLLPEAPEGIGDGITASVRGVVLEQPEPTLAWSLIQAGEGGGGGGGGGGPGFAEIDLNPGPDPTTTPLPAALAPGTPAAGLRGRVTIILHQEPQGDRTEVSFALEAEDGTPAGLYAHLEGEGLAGIEQAHQLPVRVWGTVGETTTEGTPIRVERYEPVYPDLRLRAWQGVYETTTLEGQGVILFTSLEGERYVVDTSIDQEFDAIGGKPGELILIEGVAYPDRTFGGYPVLTNLGTNAIPEAVDLSTYPLASARPFQWIAPSPSMPAGRAVVETVELAYYGHDLTRYPFENSPVLYVQPVWRFTGHYEDGTFFEILVQALADEYLQE